MRRCFLIILIFYGILFFGKQVFSASIERDGQRWEVVKFDDLYDTSFRGMLSNDGSPFLNENIVTSGVFKSCGMTGSPFQLYPPDSSSFFKFFPAYPENIVSSSFANRPFRSDGSSIMMVTDERSIHWQSVSGFNTAKVQCEKFMKDKGYSVLQNGVAGYGSGFLVFGKVQREGGFNYFSVSKIEFAQYAPGFFEMSPSLIPNATTLSVIKILLGQLH